MSLDWDLFIDSSSPGDVGHIKITIIYVNIKYINGKTNIMRAIPKSCKLYIKEKEKIHNNKREETVLFCS